MFRFLLLTKLLLFCGWVSAQLDTLNYTDPEGKKQGYWIVYGKDKPDKDYCDSCKIEEGAYLDDRRNGIWIRYYDHPNIIRLKGEFRNGRPYGDFERFDKEGNLIPKIDKTIDNSPIRIVNECGKLNYRFNFNQNGQQDGWQYYFFESCNCPDTSINIVEFAINKSNGISVDTAYRYFNNGCLKEMIIFNEGAIKERHEFSRNCDLDSTNLYLKCMGHEIFNSGPGGPNGSAGFIKAGKKFDPYGYNKVYNREDELWLDGNFRDSLLWDGKLYKYDEDGILLKIEIWKNGRYHSDGQL
ncbi:MAG: hypothetical protein R2780_02810 [Crocinitomicaceae bacterium]